MNNAKLRQQQSSNHGTRITPKQINKRTKNKQNGWNMGCTKAWNMERKRGSWFISDCLKEAWTAPLEDTCGPMTPNVPCKVGGAECEDAKRLSSNGPPHEIARCFSITSGATAGAILFLGSPFWVRCEFAQCVHLCTTHLLGKSGKGCHTRFACYRSMK